MRSMKGLKSHASLWRLMWWSLRLSWSKNKEGRRRARKHIWAMLENQWTKLVPEAVPGQVSGVTHAVWLGAALASRSLVRYPLLPKRLKTRLIWLFRLVGRTNGKALVTAYLAWVWLSDVATSPSHLESQVTTDTV
ncbi:hypothetical protein [Sulfobacillus thermosulfidooxidans]|uniref:hypothetical protein n=1 Tax=Sulfobacillus thermosulfidooxidans TaxID=28034 RepID=UPI0006843B09|nr:hypothetical protein [Sulfobacillus thermosulfidooxidans]